jgi:hypothetical protein
MKSSGGESAKSSSDVLLMETPFVEFWCTSKLRLGWDCARVTCGCRVNLQVTFLPADPTHARLPFPFMYFLITENVSFQFVTRRPQFCVCHKDLAIDLFRHCLC